jgi:hypothetical protein
MARYVWQNCFATLRSRAFRVAQGAGLDIRTFWTGQVGAARYPGVGHNFVSGRRCDMQSESSHLARGKTSAISGGGTAARALPVGHAMGGDFRQWG